LEVFYMMFSLLIQALWHTSAGISNNNNNNNYS